VSANFSDARISDGGGGASGVKVLGGCHVVAILEIPEPVLGLVAVGTDRLL
jgi:hypothetical protein